MPTTPFAVGRLASPALVLALILLGGCDRSSQTSEPAEAASDDVGREAFQEMPLPEGGSLGDDPEALARSAFGTREPIEGSYSEVVETLAVSADGQVVQLTQMGLPDDSVRGMRYRLEFAPQSDQWQLSWVGRQVLCWPGRGHEDWGTAPCQ